MLIDTEAEPRCMPGQMRRPHPKALWPKVPGYSLPSRNRSGLKLCESGKSASLWWTARYWCQHLVYPRAK